MSTAGNEYTDEVLKRCLISTTMNITEYWAETERLVDKMKPYPGYVVVSIDSELIGAFIERPECLRGTIIRIRNGFSPDKVGDTILFHNYRLISPEIAIVRCSDILAVYDV